MENPFGHDPNCKCESCQDWRDAQMGLNLLKQIKKVQAEGHVQCQNCNAKLPQKTNFCEQCGEKLGWQ